jgi:predicted dithiol-disulfide oxidoreductase (DUF899 family)
MTELRPAVELAMEARTRYPNDSDAHHAARIDLLAEEVELRRHIERVATKRRTLPPGGEPPQDYAFTDADGNSVTLSDLFGEQDTLFTYFWMYGPQRARPCPMCTSFLSSLNSAAGDLSQHMAVAVLGRSPVPRQLDFAVERGWRDLSFYQTVGDDFPRDYRGLSPDGAEWPAMDVWIRRRGRVHHFWGGELGGTQDPGQDPRGAPDPMPLWNILDLTPAGRPAGWYPKLNYDAKD